MDTISGTESYQGWKASFSTLTQWYILWPQSDHHKTSLCTPCPDIRTTLAAVSFFSCSSRVLFVSCRLSSRCRFSCEELSNYIIIIIIIIKKVLTKTPNILVSHSSSIQEVQPMCSSWDSNAPSSLLGTQKTPKEHLFLSIYFLELERNVQTWHFGYYQVA